MVDISRIEKFDQNHHIAVILAGGFGGLAAARELGRRDIPVLVLGHEKYLTKSKYGIGIHTADTGEILEFLTELPDHVCKKPVLFADSEEGIEIISDHWPLLQRLYLCPFHSNNLRLNDKLLLARSAAACGVKAPEIYPGAGSISEYPVVVKPLRGLGSHPLKKKAVKCRDLTGVEKALDLYNRYDLNPFIQQYIPGDTRDLYNVLLYRNSRGDLFFGGSSRKVREYPRRNGTGTAHVTCAIPEILRNSLRLLDAVDYIGVAEFEYKHNRETGGFYIIEVNGRFPVQIAISNTIGSSFIYRIYRDLISETPGDLSMAESQSEQDSGAVLTLTSPNLSSPDPEEEAGCPVICGLAGSHPVRRHCQTGDWDMPETVEETPVEKNILLEALQQKPSMWVFLLKDILAAGSLSSLAADYWSYGRRGLIQWALWDRSDIKPFLSFNAYLLGKVLAPACRTTKEGMKRLVDLLGSSVALVMLLPLMLAIALLVRLSGPGPVIFKQKRVGRYGKEFNIFKFRSMVTEAEDILKNDPALYQEYLRNSFHIDTDRDPRVTPIGRFLRNTSLDELPQLLNVFLGDMSIVGPRPVVREELKYYGGRTKDFLSVKPGITGYWQVSGRDGIPYPQRVGVELYYVQNHTLWLDLKIIFWTAFVVLGHKGM